MVEVCPRSASELLCRTYAASPPFVQAEGLDKIQDALAYTSHHISLPHRPLHVHALIGPQHARDATTHGQGGVMGR